jgi:hypothetical protein
MSIKNDKYVFVNKETGKYISGISSLDVTKMKDIDNILLADLFPKSFLKKMGFDLPFYYASKYEAELKKLRKQKLNKLLFANS